MIQLEVQNLYLHSASNCRCRNKIIKRLLIHQVWLYCLITDIVYYLTALPSSEHTKLAESLTKNSMAWLAFGNINKLMIRTILPAWLRIKTAHTEQPRVPVIPLFAFYCSISQFSQKKSLAEFNLLERGGGEDSPQTP